MLLFRVAVMAQGRKTPVPPNNLFRDGYWLLPRTQQVACPAGGVFLVEYDVALQLSPASARKLKREFSDPPLTPKPLQDESGRWDLWVWLSTGVGEGKYMMGYHRLVGLTLGKTNHDTLGRNLQQPKLVPACR